MSSETNNVNVTYTAKANFRDLIRSTLEARAAQKSLNDEIARGNKNSVSSSAAAAAASRKQTQALNESVAATKSATRVQSDFERGVTRAAAAVRKHNSALSAGTRAARDASTATRKVGVDAENAGTRAENMGRSFQNAIRKMLGIKQTESVVSGSLNKIRSGLDKITSARTNNNFLSGPFIVLIPLLAGVLSLLNPLVAGFGAVAAAAIGAASSLGTLGGAAVGLVPALAAALGVALALKTALSGVGGAITAGTAASKANSTAANSSKQDPFTISPTEKISRAQDAYKRSIQDVHLAEQSLFDARRQYTRQVQDLTEAVNEYTDATKAADAASVESAQQNYDNVLASSSSTKADKDSALAAIQQAQDKSQQDALQHQRDVHDLAELKQGGINNNQTVVQAQRGVTDAKNNVRDSQIAVQNAKYDAAHPASTSSTGTAAKDTDAFAAAMAKLSPAAKAFVTWFLKFRDAWLQVQKAVQQSFFSKFVGDLDDAYRVLPSVQTALVIIAGALGTIADNFLKQITGRSWQDDLVTFAKLLAPILLAAGTGLQALLDAFLNITIAGLPFLSKIVGAISGAAVQFGKFVDNGRKSGSIKKYLDDVWSVMQKWATVVSNIASTLLNYGKAAAPFGQWLTDGLVKLTGAWKTASEGALATNSPFKKWLENTKPVLAELGTVLGDFFTWVGQTASNKTNLTTITDLLKTLDKGIGPGISDILQSLVTAKVPQAFATFVSALVGFIDTLVKDGGAEGISAFFNGLTWILTALTDAAKSPIGKFLTDHLLPLIGTLAAFLLPVGPLSLLLKVLGAITNVKPAAVFSKIAGWLGDIATSVGEFVGPAFAGAATVIGDILGVLSAPIVLPKWVLPTRHDQASSPLDTKSWTKTAALALTTWAGGVPALISKAVGDAFRTTGGPKAWIGKQAKKISDWASALYKKISAAAGDVFRNVQTVAAWIGKQAQRIHDWAVNVYKKISAAAGDVFRSITGVGGWLGKQLSTITTWAGKLPGTIAKALSGLWSGLPSLGNWINTQVKNLGAFGASVGTALGLGGTNGKGKDSSGFSSGGGGSFGSSGGKSTATGKWASTISTALRMAQAPQSWGSDIQTVIDHESSGNPNAQNNWDSNAKAGHPSQGLMQEIPSTFNAYAGMLRSRGIRDPLANIYAGINYIRSRYGSPGNLAGIKSVNRGGGWIGYSTGGTVKGQGTGDTVPAMLTPGEFVVKKTAVDALGMERMRQINSMTKQARASMGSIPNMTLTKAQTASSGPFIAGDLIVNNPKSEETGDSLARAVRRVAYLKRGR